MSETPLEHTDAGLVAKGDGWFVVNSRDARWFSAPGRGAVCDYEGDRPFDQVGIYLYVLGRGESMGKYHWEADQEDFLVLSGEAVLLIEEEERSLRAWDFVHCPPNANHIIVGAGDEPCVVLAVGARERSVDNPDWGGYPVSDLALRHGVGVEEATTDAAVAYADAERRRPTRYRTEWLG